MIRTGDEYRESIRDSREVTINGEKVDDVTIHPAFKPIVDARARIYDMAHEAVYRDVMSYAADGGKARNPTGFKPPRTRADWHDKRAAVDRYSTFPFVQRILYVADMMIAAALFNARQTGLDTNPAVREKLAALAVYREGINAHLTAAIATAEESPGGLLMPNQSLLYAGHRLTFRLFTQSPPFAHLNAAYNNFDFSVPLDFVRKSAHLSDTVMGGGKAIRAAG